MHSNYSKILQVLLLLSIFLLPLRGQIAINPDHEDGVYKTGEKVTWSVRQTGDEPLDSLRYMIKRGGLEVVDQGLISLTDSAAEISYDFTAPVTVLLHIFLSGQTGTVRHWQSWETVRGGSNPSSLRACIRGSRPACRWCLPVLTCCFPIPVIRTGRARRSLSRKCVTRCGYPP